MPKLPPPPRIAQKSSPFVVALAVISSPEAVVDAPEARTVVTAAADGDPEASVDPELELRLDVADIHRSGDEGGPSIHRGDGHIVERPISKRRCHVTPPLSGYRARGWHVNRS